MLNAIRIVLCATAAGCFLSAGFGGGWALLVSGCSCLTTAWVIGLLADDEDEDEALADEL
ncbi:MAG TPA: hypothetical protein VKA46_33835 [Gemmataceae bacterium]|nr:hypothetical protein [Gemmataceae bacterium]